MSRFNVVLVAGLVSACPSEESASETALRRCLEKLESGDGWKCLGAGVTAPTCRDAWNVADEMTAACRRAYCPKLSAPKPRLCSGDSTGPEEPVDRAELAAAVLVHDHELRDPALVARLTSDLIRHTLRTSPIFVRDLDVTLPETVPADPVAQVTVTVTKAGVAIEGRAVPSDDLEEALRTIGARDGETQLVIHANENVAHERVVRVIDAAKAAGLSRFAIAVDRD